MPDKVTKLPYLNKFLDRGVGVVSSKLGCKEPLVRPSRQMEPVGKRMLPYKDGPGQFTPPLIATTLCRLHSGDEWHMSLAGHT